jgi:hypothetical protein
MNQVEEVYKQVDQWNNVGYEHIGQQLESVNVFLTQLDIPHIHTKAVLEKGFDFFQAAQGDHRRYRWALGNFLWQWFSNIKGINAWTDIGLPFFDTESDTPCDIFNRIAVMLWDHYTHFPPLTYQIVVHLPTNVQMAQEFMTNYPPPYGHTWIIDTNPELDSWIALLAPLLPNSSADAA